MSFVNSFTNVQPVGHRCGAPAAGATFYTGYLWILTRFMHIAPYAFTDLQLEYLNASGAGIPEQCPNAINIAAEVELNGFSYPVTWGGYQAGAYQGQALVPGGSLIQSEPVPLFFPAGTVYYTRTLCAVSATTMSFPGSRVTQAQLGDMLAYSTTVAAPQSALGATLTTSSAPAGGSPTLTFASNPANLVSAFGGVALAAGVQVRGPGLFPGTTVVSWTTVSPFTITLSQNLQANQVSGAVYQIYANRGFNGGTGYGPTNMVGKTKSVQASAVFLGDSFISGKYVQGELVTTAAVSGAGNNVLTFASTALNGGASLTATISGGAVTGVTVNNGGLFIAGQVPVLQFSGGGGSGASATAVISGTAISSVTGLVGGTGYTSAPTITTTAAVMFNGIEVVSTSAANVGVPAGTVVGSFTSTTVTLVNGITGAAAAVTTTSANSGATITFGAATDTNGNLSLLERGLVNGFGTSNPVPAIATANMAVTGDSLYNVTTQGNAICRLKMLGRGFTYAIDEYVSNDFTSLLWSTFTAFMAVKLSWWAMLNGHGVRVVATTVPAKTTSTDGWLTTGNQTAINAAFNTIANVGTTGQNAQGQQYNDTLRLLAAGPVTLTGAISGTTLTLTAGASLCAIGFFLTGGTIAAGTQVTAGALGGTSWTVNISQSVASTTITAIAPIWGIIDFADANMSARDSMLWGTASVGAAAYPNVTNQSGVPMTIDGQHATGAGTVSISGKANTALAAGLFT